VWKVSLPYEKVHNVVNFGSYTAILRYLTRVHLFTAVLLQKKQIANIKAFQMRLSKFVNLVPTKGHTEVNMARDLQE